MVMSSMLKFFSLETLDSRLVPSSNLKRRQAIQQSSQKSKWSTPEFRLYILVFVIVVPLMFKTAMDASNETNANYPKFERLLRPGWIFGRKVDNSDSQYRFFRDNFPMLVGLILIHSMIRQVSYIWKVKRLTFDLCFGLIFLFGAHGFNSLKIILHLTIAYYLARIPNKKTATIALWIYGIATLFINDRYRSVKYGELFSALSFMDSFKGIITRWDVFFNFTLLRFLSFNLDYLERKDVLDNEQKSSKKEDDASSSADISLNNIDQDSGSELQGNLESNSTKKEPTSLSSAVPAASESSIKYMDERQRLTAPFGISEYNYSNYLSYVLYTPLFIAGPIVTFNDYLYQTRNTLPSINVKAIAVYALRLCFCILVMEFILHYMYVVAVSKTKAWQGDTPFQISMIGMFNLNIIWLKLLIPWRLFRLWSLIDGIDPPENMIRCMDNNFSATAFWRAWHRSYNKWVIRYIYIKLGGSKYRVLASLAVFSFVAIWHDIELRLLIWGWAIVFFLVPEMIATKTFAPYSNEWWYRHLCACGAVLNIWMMMLANLFGFCLGKDGILMLLDEMFTTFDGIVFFITSSFCLFVGSQVMFELRESEKRRGIDVKC